MVSGTRQRLKHYRPLHCVTCGKKIEANRRDAKFCSPACRQKHHRQKDVTAPSSLPGKLETAVTLKRRKVWKLEERDGHLWFGDIQVTRGGGPGTYRHGTIGWRRGDWRVNGSALYRLGIQKDYWEPFHRCSDCEGWILGHPNTLRCDECKTLHDAKRVTAKSKSDENFEEAVTVEGTPRRANVARAAAGDGR
jgi:hypothetical protein